MNNAIAWLKTTCGDDSFREIARRAGLSDSIISRQLSQGAFSFDVAIAVAREYGTSVLSALVANGHVTEGEAGMSSVDSAVQAASDEQLIREIARRLDVTPTSMLWDSPISKAGGAADNVVRLQDHREMSVDDEKAAASEISEDRGEDEGYDA